MKKIVKKILFGLAATCMFVGVLAPKATFAKERRIDVDVSYKYVTEDGITLTKEELPKLDTEPVDTVKFNPKCYVTIDHAITDKVKKRMDRARNIGFSIVGEYDISEIKKDINFVAYDKDGNVLYDNTYEDYKQYHMQQDLPNVFEDIRARGVNVEDIDKMESTVIANIPKACIDYYDEDRRENFELLKAQYVEGNPDSFIGKMFKPEILLVVGLAMVAGIAFIFLRRC